MAQEGRRDFWLMANWGSIIPLVGVEPLRITPRTSKTPAYFTTKIPLTAEAIARYGVSDLAAAFILSSYNKDRDIEDVFTRKKIRCQRESGRSDHVKKLSGTSAGGIYFDGRDDYTLQKTALGSTSLIKEGHYTIRAHPGDVYLGFAVPKSGTGENIATAVIDYLESVGVSTADTEILGADGTTVNTGHLNGSMRNMELRLERPLQRAVCTLHQAELPLRKMFEHLYGPTTGPRSYSGPIGKLLKSDQLHLTPLNHHFTPLHLADIPPLERLLLSTNPDEPLYSNLVLLATYITAIYFTGHMEVKYKPSITDSPAHFYNQIRRQAQYFSGDLLKVLQKNLQTSSSSAHPDNILVGM